MELRTGVGPQPAFTVGAGGHLSLTATLATGQDVRFARGARRELPELALGLAAGGNVGLVAGRSQVASGWVGELQAALGPAARTFCEVRPHATEELCDRASAALEGVAAVAGIGGGSAIGIAKAVAARLRVPLVAVPTTYSGSELTDIYGVTRAGRKQVTRDPAARPAYVVYDPDLTDTLPPHARAASLMNCLAHCIECSWNDPADSAVVEAGLEGCRHVGQGSALLAHEDGAAAARDHLPAGWDDQGTVGRDHLLAARHDQAAVGRDHLPAGWHDRAAVGRDHLPAGWHDRAAVGRDHLLAAGMWGGLALAGGTGIHHAVCHAVGGLTGA
jgi:alcohol dehydrogenase class IV